jgi:hypothetical protein
MDPEQAALEDLVRQKRIDEIYSLRKSIQVLEEDIARGIATRRLGGDPSKAYLLLVQSYVRTLETLLSDQRRWSNTEIGRYELPDGTYQRVIGLDGFLDLQLEQTIEWTVEDTTPTTATGTPIGSAVPRDVTRTATVTPPRRIAENAFRVANATLQDAGVEIDAEDTTVGADEAIEGGGISA